MDWLQSLGPMHVVHTMQTASVPALFALLAAAGLVMGLAPSTIVMVPVVAGVVARGERSSGTPRDGSAPGTTGRALALSVAFVLGIATVDALLGALFGLVGGSVIRAAARTVPLWNLVIATMLAIMGLALARVIRVRVPVLSARELEAAPASVAGAYALGVPFGLSTCPACTPMVLPALGAAAVAGSVWLGAALLFVFGLARGLPLVLAGVSTDAVRRIERVARRIPRLERALGWALVALAAYFLIQAVRLSGLFTG